MYEWIEEYRGGYELHYVESLWRESEWFIRKYRNGRFQVIRGSDPAQHVVQEFDDLDAAKVALLLRASLSAS